MRDFVIIALGPNSLFKSILAIFGMSGFQLEFVSISQLINHMTCYKLSARWLKLQHSDWRANLVHE